MWPLGVLKAAHPYGVLFKSDLTAFPFVDLTGRHTISNYGVAQQSGRALCNLSGNAYIESAGLPQDFSILRDFDFKFLFNKTNNIAAYIAAIHDGSIFLPHYNVYVYVTNNDSIQLLLSNGNDPYYEINSATGVIALNTDYQVLVRKRGSTYKLYLNSSFIGATSSALPNIARRLSLGAINNIANSGLYGTIDDVEYRVLKTVFASDFNTFPFVDTTGRHTITNTGVTQVGSAAYFNNPTSASVATLVISDNQNDFRLQDDFEVSFSMNLVAMLSTEQLLFSLYNVAETHHIQCYVLNNGVLVIVINGIGVASTPINTIAANTTYNIRVERRGTQLRIWVNDVVSATVTIAALADVPRRLVLGAKDSIPYPGYGIYGTLDNFRFDVC